MPDPTDPLGIEKLINEPWAEDNKTLVERLEEKRDALNETIKEEIGKAAEGAQSVDDAIKNIDKAIEKLEKEIEGLIRTEAEHIREEAAKEAYREEDIEYYKWVAIKDWRTCPMCRGLDGGIIGLTIPPYMDPPIHTNCRCFTIPYELTEAEKRLYEKGENGDEGAGKATVDSRKFSEYVFKDGAAHGKDAVFKNLGYSAKDSELLAQIYQEQGAAKYASGNYTLGKLDDFGQRINIEIELYGIGNAAGKTSYINSGWIIRPDDTISLNTPFSGFTR